MKLLTKLLTAINKKTLCNLTKNLALPFTKDDVITNLSTHVLTEDENDLIRYGLSYAIPPNFLKKTDVFTIFEMISKFTTTKLRR